MRTVGPTFTLYGSNDVFQLKEVPFGVRTMGGHNYLGKYAPELFHKMGVNRQFQARTAKHKNRSISETV